MCKKSKDKKEKIRKKEAVYLCKSCKQTAREKKHLCKPKKA
jgi:hypothetical protein